MAFIVDFLLLAASGAACFYCWVLSTRIKSLLNTKNGIQTSIAALSQSVDDIQTAMARTKTGVDTKGAALEELIQQAEQTAPEMRNLIKQVIEASQTAIAETENATTSLIDQISPHIKQAQDVSIELLDSLETCLDIAPIYATGQLKQANANPFTPDNNTETDNALNEDTLQTEGQAA